MSTTHVCKTGSLIPRLSPHCKKREKYIMGRERALERDVDLQVPVRKQLNQDHPLSFSHTLCTCCTHLMLPTTTVGTTQITIALIINSLLVIFIYTFPNPESDSAGKAVHVAYRTLTIASGQDLGNPLCR